MHFGSSTRRRRRAPAPNERSHRGSRGRSALRGRRRCGRTAARPPPAAAGAARRSDGSAVKVEPDGRREHRLRGQVDGRIEALESRHQCCVVLRRQQHRPNGVPRIEQPLDRRRALRDEDLVALGDGGAPRRRSARRSRRGAGRPGRRPGSVPASRQCVRGRLRRCPETASIEHMSANTSSLAPRDRCSGSTPRRSTRSFSTLQRLELDGDTWLDHAADWLHGHDLVFDELLHAAVAAADGDHVRASAPRAALHGGGAPMAAIPSRCRSSPRCARP